MVVTEPPLTCPGSPTPAPPLAAVRQPGEGLVLASAENATDEKAFWRARSNVSKVVEIRTDGR